MNHTGIVEIAWGLHDGKEGLWLKLNEASPFTWTKVEDQYFLELPQRKKKKYSVREIRERYGNAYKPWTAEEDDLMERLYADGMKLHLICAQMGRNRGAIKGRIRKLGLREIYPR
jgi:hypothetical protein